MAREQLDPETKQSLAMSLLEHWNETGLPIIFASNILHEDLVTIHQMKKFEHEGFGLFYRKFGDRQVNFDGGGAMKREYDQDGKYIVSWTYVTGEYLDMVECVLKSDDQYEILKGVADGKD